jgi:hydroxylamine reductase
LCLKPNRGYSLLLDPGQRNDIDSALKIAMALPTAFKCGVIDLLLSLVLSWPLVFSRYELKPIAILLTPLPPG